MSFGIFGIAGGGGGPAAGVCVAVGGAPAGVPTREAAVAVTAVLAAAAAVAGEGALDVAGGAGDEDGAIETVSALFEAGFDPGFAGNEGWSGLAAPLIAAGGRGGDAAGAVNDALDSVCGTGTVLGVADVGAGGAAAAAALARA